ncbi:DUF3089 domain-containing protein [Umboniibacter marinipuniceus]|uniref:DUF3089 family protein n=1 Tax=Umboniibacter marinipuniceus TaxID=569599 RepID=A0A3M0A3Y2_9GAMM|nr:DUF3089 domain-containing protein [Umboniibacter marinipuniceus]RMA79480.1 DUF3089 family protein [Umboniibacter marinipuniceus]
MNRFIKYALSIIGVLVLLILAVFYLFRGELLEWAMSPAKEFAVADAVQAPDYRLASSWAALPGNQAGLETGIEEQGLMLSSAMADAFYVHPTGYYSPSSWNSPMNTPSFSSEQTQAMLLAQASAFSECCDVWAPEYRQAGMAVFFERNYEDGVQALDLAYEDVSAAFQVFLAERDQSRPFFIVSHSQGSVHALRLLKDFVDGKALHAQLVAAYTVGYAIPKDYAETVYSDIQNCRAEFDQGCLLHWDSAMPTANLTGSYPLWYPSGWGTTGRSERLCINPINWSTTEPASAELNLGALVVSASLDESAAMANQATGVAPTVEALQVGQYGAECRAGILRVSGVDEASPFRGLVSAEGDLHFADYQLFWGNLRANALERLLVH